VPELPAIDGVRLATAQAGIRYANRTDVLLALFDKGTTTAGVFTQSKCPSAPVEWCRRAMSKPESARAGGQFRQRQRLHREERDAADPWPPAAIAAKAAGLKPGRGLLASTG